MTDELPLRGAIFEELKCCAVSNIPRKISNIVELMKLAALVEDFPPEPEMCIRDRCIWLFRQIIRSFRNQPVKVALIGPILQYPELFKLFFGKMCIRDRSWRCATGKTSIRLTSCMAAKTE